MNDTMRHQYHMLSEVQKADMESIKTMGLEFHTFLEKIGSSRELSIAKTKIEEAVMWAVKHVTA